MCENLRVANKPALYINVSLYSFISSLAPRRRGGGEAFWGIHSKRRAIARKSLSLIRPLLLFKGVAAAHPEAIYGWSRLAPAGKPEIHFYIYYTATLVINAIQRVRVTPFFMLQLYILYIFFFHIILLYVIIFIIIIKIEKRRVIIQTKLCISEI